MIKELWSGSAWMRGSEHGMGTIYTGFPMWANDKREVFVMVFAHEEVDYLRGEAALAADKLRAYKQVGEKAETSRAMLIEAVRYQTYKELLERMGASTNQVEDWK